MKKLISISFAFLILLSGMHLTIATHFCGGELAATKVSFSGELASCGMEEATNQCTSPDKHLAASCCKNEVSALSVDHNYAPTFSFLKVFSQPVLQVFTVPVSFQVLSLTALNFINTDVNPPGLFLASAVSLPKICVFRI